jgi:large subunit ribosomal protein L9
MKVILSQDVPNLGAMGATVKVADGYARNYLLPRRLAVETGSASGKQIEHEMRNIKRREEKRRTELQEVAKKMSGLTVEITARAGEEDKLFGSVTNVMIAEKLAAQGYQIDRRSIVLEEPIKTLGIFTVPVRLGSGVEANVKVWVQAEKVAEVAVEVEEEDDEDSDDDEY